jgi:hypothetical protein
MIKHFIWTKTNSRIKKHIDVFTTKCAVVYNHHPEPGSEEEKVSQSIREPNKMVID